MTKRITKGEIAAALDNLACIKELADEARQSEGNRGYNACLMWPMTARSASRSIELLHKAGHTLPDWINTNAKWLRTIGWAVPAQAA